MRKVWIVVANSSHAKIYQVENPHKLIEKKTFEHIESHLPAHELVSDSQGCEQNTQTAGGDTYQKKTSLRTKEATHFSDEIVRFLEHLYQNGECDRLYLIAKAPFLGHLRESLSPQLTKIVHQEIHKDLIQLTAEQIREYLPPAI